MSTKDNDYYDIEVGTEEVLISNGMIEEVFYLRDLQQRKLFLNADIDQFSVADSVKHIMQINKEDKGLEIEKRKPILLYITSNGGDVDSGFELIDVIMSSKTPVYTINLGYQYSMGFLIGLAGHKRYATRIINSGTKAKDQMEFQSDIESRVKDYVISRTKVTNEEYDKHMRQEWYLFADEAKDYGMVDYIIGIDCDIDEII